MSLALRPARESVTPTAPPPTAPSGPGRGRRRWPWVAAVFLAVALAAGGIIVDAVVLSYQPLEPGSSGSATGAPVLIDSVGRRTVVFTAGPSKPFSIILQWRNSGPRAVRITGLPQDFPPYVVEPMGVLVSERSVVPGLHTERRPFAPFALAPGDSVTVEYRYRFDECEAETPAEPRVDGRSVGPPGDGWTRLRTFTVEYEVFGVARAARIEPLEDYVLATTGSCPGPPRLAKGVSS